ncbi:nucleotide-diphospho-sugar transferase [Nitzschia inconspicua]|uniref:Nucleotide-diphospho-sugar transferase n=1 Tax=Nitzschia inconspicua TaxID=303405 RepID=A0A9K3KM23_9STRA|nr:nucleotide-diphospho-sugar transferase [Nitzschia inconspicua]
MASHQKDSIIKKKITAMNSCGLSFSMLKIFLLLAIIAQGIMFSIPFLGSMDIPLIGDISSAPSDHGTLKLAESSIRNLHNDNGAIQSSSTSRRAELVPHWRVAVDCSSYNLDCYTRGQRENRYLPYPFPPNSSTIQDFQTEIVRAFPKEWLQHLQSHPITNYTQPPAVSIQEAHNLYPAAVGNDEYLNCLQFTGIQGARATSKSTLDQLDEILASGRLSVEPETKMVAFTISDYTYTREMLHDMFQMMEHVVGFSPRHFFLVAIDVETVEMACRHGYPVLFWKESNNKGLRDAVANTKLVLSFELINRGINFFFSEMDVWWIKSPKPSLALFQDISPDQTIENHLYFSGHQNNPLGANIGVYASKATKHTKEYFRVCLDLLKQRPTTHDQWVMHQVSLLYQNTLHNQSFEFSGNWGEEGPPPMPPVKYPFEARFWGPHEIAADQRPMATLETMAIHTLCNVPLLNPHGKKMIAREIGAYYGFVTDPSQNLLHKDVPVQKTSNMAGYYAREGKSYRRYLLLDSSRRTNFYSTSPASIFHKNHFFQWIVAFLLTLSKWSDRIFILPQVFMAYRYKDAGSYFSWNMMDYSKLHDFIDTRECNFLSNPKSWANDDWPFVSAAVTAFLLDEESNNATIYSQVTIRSEIISQNAWEVGALTERYMLDAFAASLLSSDSIQDTELLLVNPDFLLWRGFIDRLAHRSRLFRAGNMEVGLFERDVFEIYELLGWCWKEGIQHTVSKTSASHSCYAKGQNESKI